MTDQIGGNYQGVKHNVLEILRLLRPYRAIDVQKLRFGSENDGGYVHLDDFDNIDTVFSFGIEQNATWDLHMVNKGVNHVYQFDHTVDAPFPDNEHLIFSKTKIGPEPNHGTQTIEQLVKIHDKRQDYLNLLLKIDIESDEWCCLDATSEYTLGRFSQIIGEFHYFENLVDLTWRYRVHRVLSKITKQFGVVHIHANNHAACTQIDDLIFPNVLEISFANKQHFKLTETDETFPTNLDRPCRADRPDIELGKFRF